MRNVDEVANAIKAKYSKAESETEQGTFLYPLFTIPNCIKFINEFLLCIGYSNNFIHLFQNSK